MPFAWLRVVPVFLYFKTHLCLQYFLFNSESLSPLQYYKVNTGISRQFSIQDSS